MAKHICRDCGKEFEHNQRGRPPVKCLSCKGEVQNKAVVDIAIAPTIPDKDKISSISTEDMDFLDEIIQERKKDNPDFTSMVTVAIAKRASEPIDGSTEIKDIKYPTFRVFVTNLGWAHLGEDEKVAKDAFNLYVSKSKDGFGQVGRETVTLYNNDNVIDRHPKKTISTPVILSDEQYELLQPMDGDGSE